MMPFDPKATGLPVTYGDIGNVCHVGGNPLCQSAHHGEAPDRDVAVGRRALGFALEPDPILSVDSNRPGLDYACFAFARMIRRRSRLSAGQTVSRS
jgi:hypothetical protein